MSQARLAEIHRELAVQPADLTELQKVKRVWDKLEALRKQALKDDRYEQAYQDTLSKALSSVRQIRPADTAEEVANNNVSLWAWYDSECERLGIAGHEERRGMPHMAWCEKWLPSLYEQLLDAIKAMVDWPSPENIATTQRALTALLKGYIEAV